MGMSSFPDSVMWLHSKSLLASISTSAMLFSVFCMAIMLIPQCDKCSACNANQTVVHALAGKIRGTTMLTKVKGNLHYTHFTMQKQRQPGFQSGLSNFAAETSALLSQACVIRLLQTHEENVIVGGAKQKS